MLFLHGYGGDKRSFGYQYPFFKDKFEIYAPDLKGFGDNFDMPYPYSLDDYVKEVIDYVKKNRLVKPYVLAHSFGGRIVLKISRLYPDFFGKIVLVDSAGLKPKFSLKRFFKKFLFKVLKIFFKKEKLTKFYSKDYQSLSPVKKASFIKIVNEYLDDCPRFIDCPTLIVWGKSDKETPLYMAKSLNKKIKNSKLSVYNAGHFPFIDCAYKFNLEVREFLLE